MEIFAILGKIIKIEKLLRNRQSQAIYIFEVGMVDHIAWRKDGRLGRKFWNRLWIDVVRL